MDESAHFCTHQLDKLDEYMKKRYPTTLNRHQELSILVDAVAIIYWKGCECKPDNKEVITVMGSPFSITELEDIANKRYEMEAHTCFTVNWNGKPKKNN